MNTEELNDIMQDEINDLVDCLAENKLEIESLRKRLRLAEAVCNQVNLHITQRDYLSDLDDALFAWRSSKERG